MSQTLDRTDTARTDEARRLAALRALDVLDTEPEAIFDNLTALAAQTFRTPVALVSLIDAERQWFKSCVGMDAGETARDVAFCDHTIRQARTMLIPDATADPRFRDNPFVTGEPFIRFYAGAPLTSPDGYRLGSFCVVDYVARHDFGAAECAQLEAMAAAVSSAMTLRRDLKAYVAMERELHEAQARIRRHEEELAFLVENSADVILRLNPASVITWASPSVRRFGYAPADLVGAFAGTFVHPEDRPRLAERRPARFATLGDLEGSRREYRILHKSGDWTWIEESPTVIRDASGAAIELVNILRDIEDRKRSERAAADIQAGMLLPRAALAALSGRAEVDAALEPARNVGGDLYDAFKVGPDKLAFLVGDVTGKGVAASLFMALAKALSHSLITRKAERIGDAFRAIEAELDRSNGEAMAMSLLAGVLNLETGALALCSAGHENPLVLSADGTVRELVIEGGPPLCSGAHFPYQAELTQLEPGATLVAFTDGVTEAQDRAQQLFGPARLRRALAKAPRDGALSALTDSLVARVRAFEAGGDPSDDLAILAIRRLV